MKTTAQQDYFSLITTFANSMKNRPGGQAIKEGFREDSTRGSVRV